MKKYILGITVASTILFTGCSSEKPKLPSILDRSFDVEKGMKKVEVKKILSERPTSKQRLNDEEIWKYESNVINEKTKEGKYNNIIIKFENGVVSNIGSFSCDLPKPKED